MTGKWKYKEGNPEYERYIHSGAWREKANARLGMDGYVCRVCGGRATDVHHLTYERFGHEDLGDLVSLCRRCHSKAEEIYDPAVTPWAMEEAKPGGNNFMAAMRADAVAVAPIVFTYLMEVTGGRFDKLMGLRQPVDAEGKKYWCGLKAAVDALCRKRYSLNCVEDRRAMMLETVTDHVAVICLQQVEHYVRNRVQADLHETVMLEHDLASGTAHCRPCAGMTAPASARLSGRRCCTTAARTRRRVSGRWRG